MSRQSKGWASVLVMLAMALALVPTLAFAEALDGAGEVLEQEKIVEVQTEGPAAEEAVEPSVELQSAEAPVQDDAFVIHKGVYSMYGSIFDAVLAAVDGDTVMFARDQTVTLTEDNAMVIDKDITIDINGKTVEFVRENPYGSVLAPFEIKANVLVTGSGRFVSHASYGFCVTGDGFLTVDGGDNLTIVGDSAIGSLFRLDEFGTSVEPPRVVIENGRFEAIYSSAAHPSIWVQSGYLDIRGGSFGGNSLQGDETAGASISLEMPEGLSISGGTFEYGIRSEYSYTNAGRFITGGTFRTDLPPYKLEDYIAPGYLQDSSGQIVPYAGGLSIKVNNSSKPYNGQAQKPDITVTRSSDGKDVSDDVVYVWEGGIVPVKAGTYSLALQYGPREIGRYNFTIEPLNLSRCAVEVKNIAFTGQYEAAAKPVVKDRSGVTIPMDDYDYVSDMGVNAGDSYSVTVMPFNGEDQNVCGQQTVHFAIEPVSLDANNITWTLDPEAFLVTDEDPYEPQVTGVLNAGSAEHAPYTLVQGEDYVVKYASYALLSQGSAIITAGTSGNFTSAHTIMFPIAQPAELPVAKTGIIYDGTEQVGIEPGVGYTIEGTTGTDAGDYTAIATLEDGYAWADRTIQPKKVTWSIAKAPNGIAATASGRSVTYKTSAQTVACPLKVTGAIGEVSYTKASGAKYFSVAAKTGKLTVAKGTPVGRYIVKVTATAAGDANHQSKSVTKSVKVTVRKAANTLAVKAVKSTRSVAYGKTTKIATSKVFKVTKNVSKGKVTYKKVSGKAKITVSSAGKVTVKRGLSKGTYTVKVKVTAAATKNYKSASQTVTFKVKVK